MQEYILILFLVIFINPSIAFLSLFNKNLKTDVSATIQEKSTQKLPIILEVNGIFEKLSLKDIDKYGVGMTTLNANVKLNGKNLNPQPEIQLKISNKNSVLKGKSARYYDFVPEKTGDYYFSYFVPSLNLSKTFSISVVPDFLPKSPRY